MAGKDDGPVAKPGVDPYHIEWPDDAKEARAAERERQAKRSLVRPAPRYLTVLVLGLTVVLAFLLAVAVSLGSVGVFPFMALPVVVIALVLGLPVWVLLDRVSRRWRTGLPEVAFLVVGFTIGLSWTYAFVTFMGSNLAVFDNETDAAFFRTVSGLFMGTAAASAFMATRFWADSLRARPKLVYSLAIALVLITVLGILTWTVVPLPGA